MEMKNQMQASVGRKILTDPKGKLRNPQLLVLENNVIIAS